MNAYTTKELHDLLRRRLAGQVELAWTCSPTSSATPRCGPEEVDAERQVILEEVLMHLDEPADVVQERFAEAMFPGHPLGREVLGEPRRDPPASRSRDPVFLDKHYRRRTWWSPPPATSTTNGSRRHRGRFAGRDGGLLLCARLPAAIPSHSWSESHARSNRRNSSSGSRGPDRHSPDRFALAVLNHILGGGLSSRLFQEIREARGLAYSIGSDRSASTTPAHLAVSVGTSPEHAHEVLELLRAEATTASVPTGSLQRRARRGQGPPWRPTAAFARGLPAGACGD